MHARNRWSLAGVVALLIGCSSNTDGTSATDAATHGATSSGEGGRSAGSSHTTGSAPDGSSSTTGSGSTGGAAPCGCNGKADCAVWQDVYITWYGYNDNSCGTEAQHGCNDIANPGLGPRHHMGATAGAGTYDDPSTAAASDTSDHGHAFEAAGGVTLRPGTLIYNPVVQQYFIFEDSCLECGDEYACKVSPDDTDEPAPPASCQPNTNLHIDFWMGPSDKKQPASLGDCEDDGTLGDPYAGIGVVVVNPPPDLPVDTRSLYANGQCFTSRQVPVDSCP